MPKQQYPPEIVENAKRLYLAGCSDYPAIAQQCGVTSPVTVRRWSEKYDWAGQRRVAIEDGYTGPLVTQEALERIASEQIARLMRDTEPQPEELARWQDIISKCRANVRAIYEQACDAEIYVRTVEMMAQHMGSLPDDQRQSLAEVMEPFLNSFEHAIRSQKLRPV